MNYMFHEMQGVPTNNMRVYCKQNMVSQILSNAPSTGKYLHLSKSCNHNTELTLKTNFKQYYINSIGTNLFTVE